MKDRTRRFWATSALIACTAVGVHVGSQLRTNYETGSNGSSRQLFGMVASASDSVRLSDGSSAASYFDNVRSVVLRHYVEVVTDMAPLADGAVRGMVESLNSTGAEFYSGAEYKAIRDYYDGKAHGIGAYLQLVRVKQGEDYMYPLMVIAVAPGSPAQEAGIQPGDWIESLQGHWVANRSLRPEWESLHRQRDEGKITAEEFRKRLSELQVKAEKLILWDKAFHELSAIDRGTIQLSILRGGKEIPLKLNRRITTFETVSLEGKTLHVFAFGTGCANRIEDLLRSNDVSVIDVANNPGGDLNEVERVLGMLGASNVIGYVKTKPGASLSPLEIVPSKPLANAASITVIAGKGTSKEAELFVSALEALGAKRKGTPLGMGIRIEFYSLDTGSGFSLPTGIYYTQDRKPLLREPLLLSVPRKKEEQLQ